MSGFLDVLRDTASTIATTAGETVSLVGQVGAQRAREIVSDYLDAPEPSPQYTFTPGGVVVPGRPFTDPTGRLSSTQSMAGPSVLNRSDANAEGAITTTDAGVAGLFGLRVPGLSGGSAPLLIGGGLALAAVAFLVLRK